MEDLMITAHRKQTAYWATTGVFAGLMVLSGAMYVAGAPMIRQTLTHLGYPGYLLVILGAAKLGGSLALLQTRWPTLREWAYAGFAIDLVGAVASHLFTGDSLAVASVPALFLLMLAVSYALKGTETPVAAPARRHEAAIAA
jgi:hypothetical protein